MSSAEEFSSNESGWTKYLGSPSQQGNYSSGVYDDDDDECNYNYYHRYELESRKVTSKHKDSDNDSVASDASSGPSHHNELVIAKTINGGASSNYRSPGQHERSYYGEKSTGELKGKASKVSMIDHNRNKGTSFKQKRGKKPN